LIIKDELLYGTFGDFNLKLTHSTQYDDANKIWIELERIFKEQNYTLNEPLWIELKVAEHSESYIQAIKHNINPTDIDLILILGTNLHLKRPYIEDFLFEH